MTGDPALKPATAKGLPGRLLACFTALLLVSAQAGQATTGRDELNCDQFIVVLGTAQDAGKPQIGQQQDPAWQGPALRRLPVSLGIADKARGRRWLIEATPFITEQLYLFDQIFRPPGSPGIDGIFLTHAHIGHYTGLMFLGREAMGAKRIPVYAMKKMRTFLSENGPWSQLVALNNIELRELLPGTPARLDNGISITPLPVPHRDEFSETVAFLIESPQKRVLFLPDIDTWEEWKEMGYRVEDMVAGVDVAYLDATFFSGDELPGRDMSRIPHPTIRHTMDRFQDRPVEIRRRIRFIHMNHTNPALDPDSKAYREIHKRGYRTALRGEQICLS